MGNRRDSPTLSRFHLGDLHVHPDRMVVVRDGVDIPLEPLWMEILVVLAQKACSADETDRTVSTSELMLEVWKTDRYTDNPVTKAISGLRKAIGDDTHNPRYIKTIHRRGYRVIAPVLLPDGYLRLSNPADIWRHGNPYVGLAAFDAEHADVFVGRNNVTAKLLDAMSAQIDNELRFVLLVGASGCGKTSLLRAGALPRLTSEKRASPLHSISVADCDLSAITDGDLLMPLASALCAWSLPGGQVFSMQTPGSLKERLSEAPEAIPTLLTQAFQRHPMRDLEANPHAHLLLIVDHAEALVSTPRSPDALAAFEHALCALCETPRVLVMMVARSDYYPQLVQALPALTARKAGGHIDLLAPNRGEISEIIRRPAELASLQFETGESRLDDALRDAAVGQPDALPLLQHTLHALYERRTEQGTLTWDAYRSIGGLEGAIAHHAEQVFSALPAQAQAALDTVLGRLVVHGTDNDAVTARRVRRDSLSDDANTLVDAFIAGRLFVATLQDGHPHVGVAHEALLRQWPRAREWVDENRRLLLAHARLERAAKRWEDVGKRDDHLLNPGQPLDEAAEVAECLPERVDVLGREFLSASERAQRRMRQWRTMAIAALTTTAIIALALAYIASTAREEAETQRTQAMGLTTYLIEELIDEVDSTGNLRLLENIAQQVLVYCSLSNDANFPNEHRLACAKAYRKIADARIENNKNEEAIQLLRKSRLLSEQALSTSPDSTDALKALAETSAFEGKAYRNIYNYFAAECFWLEQLRLTDRLLLLKPDNPEFMLQKSFALTNLGVLNNDLGSYQQAATALSESVQLKNRAISSSPKNPLWEYELIVTESFISNAKIQLGQLSEAEAEYSEQVAKLERLIEIHPENLDWERQLTSLMLLRASLLCDLGNIDSAERISDESITRLQSLVATEPKNRVWRRILASAYQIESNIERIKGNRVKAYAAAENGIHILSDGREDTSQKTSTEITLRIRVALLSPSPDWATHSADAFKEMLPIIRQEEGSHLWRMAYVDLLLQFAERLASEGYHDKARNQLDDARPWLDTVNVHTPTAEALRIRTTQRREGDRANEQRLQMLEAIGYRHPDLITHLHNHSN